MGMMESWGNRAYGRKALVFVLALVVGLAVVGPASAEVVQNSPGQNQYGGEQPPATTPPTPEAGSPEAGTPEAESPEVTPVAKPDVFLPPTVASAGQEDTDSGILPFTGAALVLPSVLGGLLLAGGLFLVYRTRRHEN
jgi:LPXTG-motif cell wall-anchored protein